MTTVDVEFAGTWLINPADLSAWVTAPMADRGGSFQLAGSVRAYAGGRQRVITTAGKLRTFTVTLQSLSDADLAVIDAWAGQVLLLRDAYGWRKWVTYLQPTWSDVLHTEEGVTSVLHDVQLPLTEITFPEPTA